MYSIDESLKIVQCFLESLEKKVVFIEGELSKAIQVIGNLCLVTKGPDGCVLIHHILARREWLLSPTYAFVDLKPVQLCINSWLDNLLGRELLDLFAIDGSGSLYSQIMEICMERGAEWTDTKK